MPVLKSTGGVTPSAWSPDGNFALYRTLASGGSNLGILPLSRNRSLTGPERSDPTEGRTPHL
jgi:hypothetical protein